MAKQILDNISDVSGISVRRLSGISSDDTMEKLVEQQNKLTTDLNNVRSLNKELIEEAEAEVEGIVIPLKHLKIMKTVEDNIQYKLLQIMFKIAAFE